MALVKRKHQPTTSITLRVPLPLKSELIALRKLAAKADVDFNASIGELLATAFQTMRSELDTLAGKAAHANGSREA